MNPNVRQWLGRVFGLCRHEFVFEHNIYGDLINLHDGKRSYWRCVKCRLGQARPQLHKEQS